jgi:uncharacterized damage-inducible protein DinB
MPALVNSGYLRTMAAYNAAMNTRLYDAAARLSDDARKQDRGAFFKSIHGTLCHLLWADHIWMARFDGWEKPVTLQKDSGNMIEDFAALRTAREDADKRISDWAARATDDWTDGPVTWRSATTGTDLAAPASYLAMHFFNHQTHHRGQAHALITAAGEATGDTDLLGMVPPQS